MLKKNHKTLVIVPSMRCNLSCSFCLCLESLNTSEGSSVENMIKFLSWQIELDKDASYNIELFGGEPTLAWGKIKEVYSYISTKYPSLDVSWTIFTNGLFPKELLNEFDLFVDMFDEIILSVEGSWEHSKLRHPKESSHKVAIENLKRLIPYNNVGVGFVVFPDTPLREVFSYFSDMGVRYYNFEIVTHINNDKSSGVTLKDIFNTLLFIHDNILLYNIEHPEEYRLFTIPRELLSAKNYLRYHRSCLESIRSLAPSGNIYFCRDQAVNEDKLLKQSDPKSIYRSNQIVPFNIRDFQLDVDSNDFSDKAKQYTMWNSCPVKSYEHFHFIGGKQEWIHNLEFQDTVIRCMFELSWLLFSIHSKGGFDEESYEQYYRGVTLYREVLSRGSEFI